MLYQKKKLAALLLIFALMMALTSQCFAEAPAEALPAAKSPEEIKERNVLRVGTAGDYQPMSYLDPAAGRMAFDRSHPHRR